MKNNEDKFDEILDILNEYEKGLAPRSEQDFEM
jgi:hypothetical protein